LSPNGFAEDGEVEDHQIELQANPRRNPDNGLDVDQSGIVVPLDALIVINDLNRNGPRQLPNPPVNPPPPPPFLDTNGDGFVTAQDVLVIINFLNSGAGEGEGQGLAANDSGAEGEGDSSTAGSNDANSFGRPLVVTLVDDLGMGTWSSGTSYVDHRLTTDETSEDEDLFAVMDEFGLPEEPLIDSVAGEQGTSDGASYADLLDNHWDPARALRS
jgi:hypothetical protein